MLKTWWKSRTIWAGVLAMGIGGATLADILPDKIEQGLAIASIINGAFIIYFRRTTRTGILGAMMDNRITGSRT